MYIPSSQWKCDVSDGPDHISKLVICPYAPTFSTVLSKYCCLLNTVRLTHIAIQTMSSTLTVPKKYFFALSR